MIRPNQSLVILKRLLLKNFNRYLLYEKKHFRSIGIHARPLSVRVTKADSETIKNVEKKCRTHLVFATERVIWSNSGRF